MQVVAARGGQETDLQVFKAVHSIFHELEKLRASHQSGNREFHCKEWMNLLSTKACHA